MALALSKVIIKTSAVGGFIYFTVAEGVWSSSSDSRFAFEQLRERVVPHVSRTLEQLPYEARVKWNEGVKSSFACLNSVSSDSMKSLVHNSLKKAKISKD